MTTQLSPDTLCAHGAPAEHPIWHAHTLVPPTFVALEGVEMGCKTVVVFSPQPVSGYWEVNARASARGPACD